MLRHNPTRVIRWGPKLWVMVVLAVLCLPVSSWAVGLSYDTAFTQPSPLYLDLRFAPKDTALLLDVGDFTLPSTLPPVFEQRLWIEPPTFSFLGPPHAVSAEIDALPLDLLTFRAFQRDDQVIDGWNREAMMLMKQTDRQKQGELRIGVQLPKAVESILGEGGAGLKVSGYRRILFSGRSQWTDATSVGVARQNKFPSLTMDQISRFTVEGTVGSKVFVKVDQDSKRQSDLENRIQIRYRGDEDDILQSIEAGNTTLSLPNTQFVGYSQRIQGLFGLKATAQLGPLDFTMITSQEKGNTVRNRYTAGSEEGYITIRDYEYAKGRFYDLGRVEGVEPFWQPNDWIRKFELYEYDQSSSTQLSVQGREGAAWADARDTTISEFLPYKLDGRWRPLGFDPRSKFTYSIDDFYVFFESSMIQSSRNAMAYYMEVGRLLPNGDTLVFEIGNTTGDYFTLQLLRTQNPDPSDPLWDAEWKNVYDLGIRKVNYEDLELDIYRGTRGTEEQNINVNHQDKAPYLEILGLDKENVSGAPSPDGKIDNEPTIIDLERGLLFFPDRRPFDPPGEGSHSLRFPNVTLDPKVSQIYETRNTTELQNSSEYYIRIKTRNRSTTISLRQIGIMRDSEVITFNGQRLTRGVQYTIDYDIGKIVFNDEKVLDPNFDLTIDYEYAPFLSVDKKTLFGLRTEYAPHSNFRTGATVLYKGSKATNRPAQLGQEPFRDMVFDYDVFWKSSPKFFTKFADAVPFVDVGENVKSNLSIAAEIARSLPNPNTRSEVYIDDFEGTRQASPLGILRVSFSIAPPPLDRNTMLPLRVRNFFDPGFIWYNPYTQFRISDIYERELENPSDDRTQVLVLDFNPEKSVLRDSVNSLEEVWGGMIRGLPRSTWDQRRAEFLEIRMSTAADTGVSKGVLHIDLGRISEDIDLDGFRDTEDANETGKLEEGEDVGLDGIPDELEVSPDGTPYDPVTNPDPAGDNWFFNADSQLVVRHINGTEGNSSELLGGKPDSEDIGGETRLDLENNYYAFEIDLDNPDPRIVVEGSERQQASEGNLIWKTYRIPLWDASFYEHLHDPENTSPPDSNNIQYVRLWMDGASGRSRVYIASFEIVENRWKGELAAADDVVEDTTTVVDTTSGFSITQGGWVVSPAGLNRTEPPTFLVAVKNTETDVTYESPPGVSGYRDPRTRVREKEQSISLEYDKFLPGDTGRAVFASTVAQDFTGYRYMRLFIHGDDNADADGKTVFYLKFGQSEDVYYYYRDTVRTGWEPNTMVIDFNALTVFKEESRRRFLERGETLVDTFNVETKVGIHGLPSLSQVSHMEMGVIRTGDATDPPARGAVWCDELQLTDVRKDPGTAGRIAVTAKFADLMGVSANISGKSYSFRTLTDGRAGSVLNAYSNLNTTISANLTTHKILLDRIGLSIPMVVRYSNNVQTPKLLTGSDVILSDSLRKVERTIVRNDNLSGSIQWQPGDHWLVKNTIGALKTTFSLSRSNRSSPTAPADTSTGYNIGATYGIRFSKRLTFPPLFWTRFLLFPKRFYQTPFSLLPESFNASARVNRNLRKTVNSNGLFTSSYTRSFDGNLRLTHRPIPAINMTYNMTTVRDLANPEELRLTFNPKRFRLGRESRFNQKATFDYKPTLFTFFSPAFSFSADFKDNIDRSTFDHDVGVSRRMSIGGSFDIDRFWTAISLGTAKPGTSSRRRQRSRKEDVRKKDKADSLKTGSGGKTTGKGFGPRDLWGGIIKGMRMVTSPVKRMSVNLSRQNADSRRNLYERPPPDYQFGFNLYRGVEFDEVVIGGAAPTNIDAFTESDAISVKNDFNFLRVLKINSEFSRAESKRQQPGTDRTNDTRQISETFPRLSTGFSKLEKLPLLRWVFSTASASIAYTRKHDESWRGDELIPLTDNTTKGFSPFLRFEGRTKKGVRFSLVIDRTTSESNPAQSLPTRRNQNSARISFDYSFRSPNGIPLPFLRGIRLSSQMTLSLQILRKSSETLQEISDATGKYFETTQLNQEFTVSPRANYSFSSRVNGGFTAKWTDSKDNNRGALRKSHIRELGIWAEFKF